MTAATGLVTTAPPRTRGGPAPYGAERVTLLDLLDRLLEGGVVIAGDVTLAVADIDLVDLSLRLVVGSVGPMGRDLRGPLPKGQGAA